MGNHLEKEDGENVGDYFLRVYFWIFSCLLAHQLFKCGSLRAIETVSQFVQPVETLLRVLRTTTRTENLRNLRPPNTLVVSVVGGRLGLRCRRAACPWPLQFQYDSEGIDHAL